PTLAGVSSTANVRRAPVRVQGRVPDRAPIPGPARHGCRAAGTWCVPACVVMPSVHAGAPVTGSWRPASPADRLARPGHETQVLAGRQRESFRRPGFDVDYELPGVPGR